MEERLSLTEAAAYIGRGQSRISQLMKEGRVTFEREKSGRVYIRKSECERIRQELSNPPVEVVERKAEAQAA